MLLEARDDTATRQGVGQTTYDGVGSTAGSTDTTETSVGVVGMEVERSTDGEAELDRGAAEVTVKKKKKKSKKRSGRKTGMTQSQRRDDWG